MVIGEGDVVRVEKWWTGMRDHRQRRWLNSVLATPKGGSHPDLGTWVKQVEGRAGFIDGVCARCGLPPVLVDKDDPFGGHDPCLMNLPGVNNACCGHGETFAYAILSNGWCLTGRALKVYLEKVGRLQHFQKLAGERGWYMRRVS
jgi:hypothetical protein